MGELETFTDVKTVRAIIGDTIVGVFQRPVVLATDWKVYLKSDDPIEEKRREDIRQELCNKSAAGATEEATFLEFHNKIGSKIDITIGDVGLFPHG
ncbi:MAG: hypothetical protein A3B47_02165 [Candidatus Levybacteria bacterium RIFCSPLOWO2_01_FULL_39_24]|nr:MAG: hypothetical protein A2800_01460 [Candidatus Levybacteria bacterium RIFCSPHIGHO2_01_FULL_40_16]OGH28681.1 MAG: hypothetical protein A3E12_00115 [Candidatus Levybacteria bacterium RIFCSPHIGHO2_12_FULL_39_9]OGH46444.1 MAG: hypothetical protein A3B47_02165 [Candidatus Levybacteria bacterium RIFCSPLOWO2_01_FULL_39_24]